MYPAKSAFRLLLAAASLATASAQTTYVVDDSGGTGVDFTNIQSALNVAGPTDLVEVRPGSYSAFVMAHPTRVIGTGNVLVTGTSRVENIDTGEWTLLAGLSLDNCVVQHCDGVVLFDDLKLGDGSPSLSLNSSSDVRATSVGGAGFPTLRVHNSRLQLVDADFGRPTTVAADEEDGREAARVTGNSFVHAVRSSFTGEWGGYAYLGGNYPGDGADGIVVDAGATVRFDECTLVGGLGGLNSFFPGSDGRYGVGMYTFGGGHIVWNCSGTTSAQLAGAFDTMTHVPSFLLASTIQPGQLVTLSVRGEPTGSGRILVGRFPVTVDQPATRLERLVDVGRLGSLGAMPATGERSLQFVIPTTWIRGTVVFMQTSSTDAGGMTDLSNAIALLVR